MKEQLQQFLEEQFGDVVLNYGEFRGEPSWYVKPEAIADICEALHDDPGLQVTMLSDIVSVDWIGHEPEPAGRFELIYNLYSLKHRFRFFLRTFLPGESPEVPSLTALWQGANWLEREVWDMMGIKFVGHPELTKILTPDELEGHPLRRDFPLTWEEPVFSWNKNDPPEVIR